jgi:hypothetical protein
LPRSKSRLEAENAALRHQLTVLQGKVRCASMTTETRLGRALRLRDIALAIVRRQGTWKRAGKVNLLMASHGTISIGYRTPFQRLPDANNQLKYMAAQLGRRAPQNLPYGLDIWAPKKVLNVEWDDQGNVVLVSFRPGEWEAELAAA